MLIRKSLFLLICTLCCVDAYSQIRLEIQGDTINIDMDRVFNFIPITIENEYLIPVSLLGFRNFAETAMFVSDSLEFKHTTNIGFTFRITDLRGQVVFPDLDMPQPLWPTTRDCEMLLNGVDCDDEWIGVLRNRYMAAHYELDYPQIVGNPFIIKPGEIVQMQLLVLLDDFDLMVEGLYRIDLAYIVNDWFINRVDQSALESIPNRFSGIITANSVWLRVRR